MGSGILRDQDSSELEDAIYEAAVIPEKWAEVLERISVFGGGKGLLCFQLPSGKHNGFHRQNSSK